MELPSTFETSLDSDDKRTSTMKSSKKVPPVPPPKPNRKPAEQQPLFTSDNSLDVDVTLDSFEDEGEDGTEI
jgi:hypothetical protein